MNALHKIIISFSASVAIAGSAISGTAYAASVTFDSSRDCDNNAVIRCGAMTTDELQTKYGNDASVAAIYDYFGVSAEEVGRLGSQAVAGYVTKTGDVVVNGKVVAKNAITAGRQDITGSTKVTKSGTAFYVRSPKVSFRSDKIDAFVVLGKDGQFRYAILAACGNAVKATNVVPAAVTPTTTPTPTPAPAVKASAPAVGAAPVKAPEALPATGPASIISLFVASTVMGVVAHHLFQKRRLA